jgi:hypothetical protein
MNTKANEMSVVTGRSREPIMGYKATPLKRVVANVILALGDMYGGRALRHLPVHIMNPVTKSTIRTEGLVKAEGYNKVFTKIKE